MCGLLQYSLHGTHDDAQNREEELTSTLSDLKVDERDRMPMRAGRLHMGKHIVATVHGDDITIGGERSAVEFLIKVISRTYEIKKQVIGEDADLEKSGRILHRVVKLRRGGITIDMPGTYWRISTWSERITQRLRALWKGGTRRTQEVIEARERTKMNRDSANSNTVGTMQVTVTTRTRCR